MANIKDLMNKNPGIVQSVAGTVNTLTRPPKKPGGATGGSMGRPQEEAVKPGSNSVVNPGMSRPPQSTTYKAPGTDDLGNVDQGTRWDNALSGGSASYDEMLGIYKDRQDKINSGDPYGQFAGDAKSKEMEAWLQANDPKNKGGGTGDYSSYIEDMYKAQQAAALAALRNAYNKNVAGLDRAQADIAPQYQNARNEAAGQAELQKKNFAEYAAAAGLNSGAGGQAQLSFQNALQNNLSGIAQKEASTLADLELQRTQMAADYENAIAQAKAQGNFELAQQLYQEKVRQDEQMLQQMQFKAQQDLAQQQLQFNKDQAAVGNSQWEKQYQSELSQWDENKKYQWAAFLAQYGDFSGLRALGYTEEQIASLMKKWEQSSY